MKYTKFAVIRDHSNYQVLNEWFNKAHNTTAFTGRGEIWEGNPNYLHYPKTNGLSSVHYRASGYKLISFEEFQIYIVNQTEDCYEIY